MSFLTTLHIILGDFNYPKISNPSSPLSHLLSEHNMLQHINFPTHSLVNTLDLIISPSNSNLIKNIKSTPFFLDHALIFCNLNLIKHPPAPIISVRRCYSRVNYTLVEKDLLTLSQNLSHIDIHVDNFTHHLNESLTYLLDQHAPLRTFKFRVTCVYRLPISYEARLAKRQLRKIERSSSDRLHISLARAKARRLIQSSCTNHLRTQLDGCSQNPKRSWNIINSIFHNSPPIPPLSQTEENNLASSFSTFFNNKIINIHQPFESIQQDMRRVKNCSLTEKKGSCDVVQNELTMDTQSTTHENNNSDHYFGNYNNDVQ